LKPSDSFKNVVANTKDLFNFIHETYKGPLFGEGGYYWGRYDSYYAGDVDGVARQIERGLNCDVIPDYELKIIRPLMANHGMGYYDRFFPTSSFSEINYNYDAYRATEIAYGHAGFIDCKFSSRLLFPPEHQMLKVKEYYLMQQLQKQYLRPDVDVEVEYLVGERYLGLDDALREDIDFKDVRLRLQYDNGLEIYVNRNRKKPWDNLLINMKEVNLPPSGWYAINRSSGFIAYTAKNSRGEVVDYVNSDVYTFAESRSRRLTQIEDVTTDGMAIINHREFNRRDVCLLGGTIIEYAPLENGVVEIESEKKVPCYLTIKYKSENLFNIMVDFQSRISSVIYKDIPESWLNEDGVLPVDNVDFIKVEVTDMDGNISFESKSVKVTSPDGITLKFEGLRPLINYLVTINPQ